MSDFAILAARAALLHVKLAEDMEKEAIGARSRFLARMFNPGLAQQAAQRTSQIAGAGAQAMGRAVNVPRQQLQQAGREASQGLSQHFTNSVTGAARPIGVPQPHLAPTPTVAHAAVEPMHDLEDLLGLARGSLPSAPRPNLFAGSDAALNATQGALHSRGRLPVVPSVDAHAMQLRNTYQGYPGQAFSNPDWASTRRMAESRHAAAATAVDRTALSGRHVGTASPYVPVGSSAQQPGYAFHGGAGDILGPHSMKMPEAGSATWWSGYPDVAAGYSRGRSFGSEAAHGVGYVAGGPTSALAGHGPASPSFHPHVFIDTRGMPQNAISNLPLHNTDNLSLRPHYEGVFTSAGHNPFNNGVDSIYKTLPGSGGLQNVWQRPKVGEDMGENSLMSDFAILAARAALLQGKMAEDIGENSLMGAPPLTQTAPSYDNVMQRNLHDYFIRKFGPSRTMTPPRPTVGAQVKQRLRDHTSELFVTLPSRQTGNVFGNLFSAFHNRFAGGGPSAPNTPPGRLG